MDTDIRVKEAMTRKVITVPQTATANKVAELMEKNNIGCVIIAENEDPIGIVTERDLSFRIVAKNKKPGDIKVGDIMSGPLKTTVPNATLSEAIKLMAKYNIRRLPVIDDKKLVGIITDKDIIHIAPNQIEILRELSKMRESQMQREVPESGTCENCGDYGVALYEVNGIFVCESCKEDLMGGEG